MPATYTYNDAIDDACIVIAEMADEIGAVECMPMYVRLINKLINLKRPNRRRRTSTTRVNPEVVQDSK